MATKNLLFLFSTRFGAQEVVISPSSRTGFLRRLEKKTVGGTADHHWVAGPGEGYRESAKKKSPAQSRPARAPLASRVQNSLRFRLSMVNCAHTINTCKHDSIGCISILPHKE